MWWCAFGLVFTDAWKKRNSLQMKALRSFETSGNTQRHRVTSRKNWVLSSTAVKTSNLARIPVSGHMSALRWWCMYRNGVVMKKLGNLRIAWQLRSVCSLQKVYWPYNIYSMSLLFYNFCFKIELFAAIHCVFFELQSLCARRNAKCPSLLSDYNQNVEVSTNFCENLLIQNVTKEFRDEGTRMS
jgi:hypothetical protein